MTHDAVEIPFDPRAISASLLAWYGERGRDLPWRHTRDPYRIWLSEVMLQQTTVAAVIPYYQRFLQHCPTVEALAAASLDEVITQWAGLGYYSRARNLHRAARQVVTEHHGRFPETLPALLALPGIGRSTAGAILSIAFDLPAPILDGNVRRVLVRLFAWREDPRSARAEKQLWAWAEALTSADRPHDYAQAIMDLGAMICTPTRPDCEACPLERYCQACVAGISEQLPLRRTAAKIPVRQQIALVVRSASGVLVRQRPATGLLGGLWELPCVELSAGQDPAQVAARLQADLGLQGELVESGAVRHAYSHFKLELTVFAVAAEASTKVAESPSSRWCSEAELADLPLHGAHRKAYNQFSAAADGCL